MKRINNYLLEARKAKDSDKIKFYSTLKGEVESELKRSQRSEKEIIEATAKKWMKNLKTLGTPEAEREMKLLEEFAPTSLSKEKTIALLEKIASENEQVFKDYLNGNGGMAGRIMGLMMKASNGTADPVLVNKVLQRYAIIS